MLGLPFDGVPSEPPSPRLALIRTSATSSNSNAPPPPPADDAATDGNSNNEAEIDEGP
jgi:hypothetical protein